MTLLLQGGSYGFNYIVLRMLLYVGIDLISFDQVEVSLISELIEYWTE